MDARPSSADALVIGAGIAGCAVAKALADQGRQVTILERRLAEPDRIVGELLQPGGVAALGKLGLRDCLEGIDAIPVFGYHVFWRREEEASFWYCAPPGAEEKTAKPSGKSFHHGRFVGKLRERVSKEPRITLVEASASGIIYDGNSGGVVGVSCGSKNHTEYYGDIVVLADGATSNLRPQVSPSRPKAHSRFWGLELIDADLPLHGYAYGIIGSGPPMLLYQISKHETRILIEVMDDTYKSLGGKSQAMRSHISEHVVPLLPERFQPSLSKAIEGGRLRSMPNGWMPSCGNSTPGLIVLGDALNMRHPLTGGGMTVALKDVVLLADLLAPADIPSLADSDMVLHKMKLFATRRRGHAATLNIIAQSFHVLFAAKDPRLKILQRGFFRYVEDGEQNFAEPVGIMGGMIENPSRLLCCLVSIAFYSIKLHLGRAGIIGFPVALYDSVMVVISALSVIILPILYELVGG